MMKDSILIGGLNDNLDEGELDDHGFFNTNDVNYGCTTEETGMFVDQEANGIFGLYSASDSKLKSKPAKQFAPNIVDSLYHSNSILSNSFSLCLGNKRGYLTLGGFRSDRHKEGSPIINVSYKNNTNYEVHVYSIKVFIIYLDWQ